MMLENIKLEGGAYRKSVHQATMFGDSRQYDAIFGTDFDNSTNVTHPLSSLLPGFIENATPLLRTLYEHISHRC